MILKCKICGSEFIRYGKQIKTAKTCSTKCMGIYNKAKNNTKCTQCGKDFHLKESAKKRYKRTLGYFCSVKCASNHKKTSFKGSNNHQFGLKADKNASFKGLITTHKNHGNLDLYIYVGPDYPKSNSDMRVLFHRYLVQENYNHFDLSFFDEIKGKFILKNGFDVHHKDHNHNNNELSNLEVLSRSLHTKIHNEKKHIIRDSKNGRIIKIKKVK